MAGKRAKYGRATLILDKLLRGDVGDSIEIPWPTTLEESQRLQASLRHGAQYRKVRVRVEEGVGFIKATYLGVVRESAVRLRTQGKQQEAVVNVTLAVNVKQWAKLVKMAAHTGCEAALDGHGNVHEAMKSDSVVVFASEMLDAGIVAMWKERGYEAEYLAKLGVTE